MQYIELNFFILIDLFSVSPGNIDSLSFLSLLSDICKQIQMLHSNANKMEEDYKYVMQRLELAEKNFCELENRMKESEVDKGVQNSNLEQKPIRQFYFSVET